MNAGAANGTLKVDTHDVGRQLRLMFPRGEVFEVRALKVRRDDRYRPRTESGFFDNPRDAMRSIEDVARYASAVYATLNLVDPDLLFRRCNRMGIAEKGEAAQDAHIFTRRHMLVDSDPERLAGISSTHEENSSALTTTTKIISWLSEQG